MSEIMLQAVLRMPPTLWGGGPIDVVQRHVRYVQAADEIERLNAMIDRLPKLRDGTPITIGMVVYDSTRLGHDGERISGFTTHPDGRLACLYFTDGVSIGFDTAVDYYYGSREAAEKARAEP